MTNTMDICKSYIKYEHIAVVGVKVRHDTGTPTTWDNVRHLVT